MTMLQKRGLQALAGLAALGAATFAIVSLADSAASPVGATKSEAVSIERGRYVAQTAGCNDCHTAGYAESAGRVAESGWLTGDRLGWRGPWGTTYPANLRIFMGGFTEEAWLQYARNVELRPPMPWFNLRDMSDADLRSFYRYVRSLGVAGERAPPYVEPGVVPAGPFVQFPAPPAQ